MLMARNESILGFLQTINQRVKKLPPINQTLIIKKPTTFISLLYINMKEARHIL